MDMLATLKDALDVLVHGGDLGAVAQRIIDVIAKAELLNIFPTIHQREDATE